MREIKIAMCEINHYRKHGSDLHLFAGTVETDSQCFVDPGLTIATDFKPIEYDDINDFLIANTYKIEVGKVRLLLPGKLGGRFLNHNIHERSETSDKEVREILQMVFVTRMIIPELTWRLNPADNTNSNYSVHIKGLMSDAREEVLYKVVYKKAREKVDLPQQILDKLIRDCIICQGNIPDSQEREVALKICPEAAIMVENAYRELPKSWTAPI